MNPTTIIRSILLLTPLMFLAATSAHADPTAVQVCVQVEDDLDANGSEGGAWDYTVGDQSNDLTGGVGEQVTRTEDQSASALTCGTAFSFTPSSSGLSIFQQLPTFDWVANASGSPTWQIVDAANTATVFATGAGQNASLNQTEFEAIPDGTTIAVNYINREARRISFCKEVQDNGDANTTQGATYSFLAEDVAGQPTVDITADETTGQVCAPTQLLELPFAQPTQRFREGGLSNPAPGFPVYTYSDSNGNADVVDSGATFRSTVDLSALEDDVLISVTNRFDVPRTWQVCKILEDNGDGVDNGGNFRIGVYPFIQNVGGTTIRNVPEDGTEVCGPIVNSRSTFVDFISAETGYDAIWDGNAIGYPQWELRDRDTDNVLASGVGDSFEWSLVDDTVNGMPAPNTLVNLANMKIVFINREGDFGNGADATTGAVMKPCKLVEDNGDAILDGGTFTIAYNYEGTSTISGLPISAFPFYFGVRIPVTATEADGTVCAEGAVGLPAWINPIQDNGNGHVFETQGVNAAGAVWRGSEAQYPRLRFEDVGTNPLPDATTPYDEFMVTEANTARIRDVDIGAIGIDSSNDFRTVVVNRGPAPTTYQMCAEFLDNGLAPVDSFDGIQTNGPVLADDVEVRGTLAQISEGSGVVCDTPRPLTGWPTSNVSRFIWLPPSGDNWTFDPGFPFIDWELFEPGTTNLVASGRVHPARHRAGAGQIDMIRPPGATPAQGVSLADFWDGTIDGVTPNCQATNGCDLRMTMRIMTPPPVEICSRLLFNGDARDDSDSFDLSVNMRESPTTATFTSSFTAALTEGGAQECFDYTQISSPVAASIDFSEVLPGPPWDTDQTPGFALFRYTDPINDPTPVEGNGIAVNVERGCAPGNPFGPSGAAPDATLCPFTRGPLTATFFNRLGPLQTVQYCQEIVGNGDGTLNQGGDFVINGRHDDIASQFGDKALTATEDGDATSGLVCATAQSLPPVALNFGGSQTTDPAISIPNWPGTAAGFPRWRVMDASGEIASGSGDDTGDIPVNTTSGNIQVIFSTSPLNINTLTVNKTVVGASPGVDWSFEVSSATAGCLAAPLTQTIPAAGGSTAFNLPEVSATDNSPCEYTVAETPQDGWGLTAASCNVASTPDFIAAAVSGVLLNTGVAVQCDFQNTEIVEEIEVVEEIPAWNRLITVLASLLLIMFAGFALVVSRKRAS